MGGGPSSTTSQTTFQPSAQGQAALNQYLAALQNQVFQGGNPAAGLQGFPAGLNQQVAPFNQTQRSALRGISNITPQAMNLTGLGANTQAQFASGQMLNNPYLNSLYNQSANQLTQQYQNATEPSLMAQGEQSGAIVGTGFQTGQEQGQYGLGQGLATLGAGIYEPAYQFNQGQMLQAAQGLPQAAMSLYGPLAAQYGAGAAIQAQQQSQMNTGYQNALARVQFPYAQLAEYGQGVAMALGSGGTSFAQQPVVGGQKL